MAHDVLEPDGFVGPPCHCGCHLIDKSPLKEWAHNQNATRPDPLPPGTGAKTDGELLNGGTGELLRMLRSVEAERDDYLRIVEVWRKRSDAKTKMIEAVTKQRDEAITDRDEYKAEFHAWQDICREKDARISHLETAFRVTFITSPVEWEMVRGFVVAEAARKCRPRCQPADPCNPCKARKLMVTRGWE